MTLTPNRDNREFEKFVENPDGSPSIRTLEPSGWLMEEVGRKIVLTLTSATVETYTYQEGATVKFTIVVTYTDASKATIDNVERTT